MGRQRKVTSRITARILIESQGTGVIQNHSEVGWSLTQESFDQLLYWLDPDRDQAGRKYESIRLRLIKVFSRYGWSMPEELADESINRVAKKIDRLASSFVGSQEAYFIAVGQKVHLEYRRIAQKRATTPIMYPLALAVSDDLESKYQRLDRCMQKLSPEDGELILQYYQDNKQARIDCRKRLAEQLGIEQTALRLRAYRIRRTLQELYVQPG